MSQTKIQFNNVLLFLGSRFPLFSKSKMPRNVLSRCTTSSAPWERSPDSNFDNSLDTAKKVLALSFINSYKTFSGTTPKLIWDKKDYVPGWRNSVLTVCSLFYSTVLFLWGTRKLSWVDTWRLQAQYLDVRCLFLQQRCC